MESACFGLTWTGVVSSEIFFFLCVGFSLIAIALFAAAADGDDVRRGGGWVMWGCLCMHDEGDGAGLPVACFLLPVVRFFLASIPVVR